MDCAAALLELAGVWLVGSRDRRGFLLALGCNALWVCVAWRSGLAGLGVVSCVMAAVNVRNYLRWSNEDARQKR